MNGLTYSQKKYLFAIYKLGQNGEEVKSSEVAKLVGVSKGNVPEHEGRGCRHLLCESLKADMMAGYIPYVISPVTYIITVSTGLICYIVVALLQMRKVAKVSKSEALKNVE